MALLRLFCLFLLAANLPAIENVALPNPHLRKVSELRPNPIGLRSKLVGTGTPTAAVGEVVNDAVIVDVDANVATEGAYTNSRATAIPRAFFRGAVESAPESTFNR